MRSGTKKAFLASLLLIPAGAYVYIRNRQVNAERTRRLLEEEGRKNWNVTVGRSGGGV